MANRIRLVGLDPGLTVTGWGVIDAEGTRLSHVANGKIRTDTSFDLSDRLVQIHDGLAEVLADWQPDYAAVEETFVNKNAGSTLKLGVARGIALLVPALSGIRVAEYSPNHVKKAVVGSGHADKGQIHAMVNILLPGITINGPDAADALAVAICHAHHRTSGVNTLNYTAMAGAKA